MNLFPKHSLESQIITHLQKNSWITVDLIKELQKIRPKLSKQAVYQIIRKLKKVEIVVVTSKRVSLSSLWIDRMYDFFTVAKYVYEGAQAPKDTYKESFLSLEDGDQITYIFKNPNTTDIFWGHSSNILRGIMPEGEPMYFYMPHEWFILAREPIEKALLQRSEEDNHPWYVYIPHKDPLDEYVKPIFKRPHLFHTNPKAYFKDNFYINTHGDYIIEVTLDPKAQKSIDEFYKTYSVWDESARTRLTSIISNMKGKNKLTISRNKKKSDKIKKLLGKYFV